MVEVFLLPIYIFLQGINKVPFDYQDVNGKLSGGLYSHRWCSGQQSCWRRTQDGRGWTSMYPASWCTSPCIWPERDQERDGPSQHQINQNSFGGLHAIHMFSTREKADEALSNTQSNALSTDLADVIGDPTVADDVQGVLDGVVVSLGQLEGLFVAQLETWTTTTTKVRRVPTTKIHRISIFSIFYSVILIFYHNYYSRPRQVERKLKLKSMAVISLWCIWFITLISISLFTMAPSQRAYSHRWTGGRPSWHGSRWVCQRWRCTCASSSHTVVCTCSRGERNSCNILECQFLRMGNSILSNPIL